MTTIKDVARYANVSLSTVSKYINNSPTLTDEYRERVAEAVKALNYKPNRMAQNLRANTSSTIALVVPDVNNPLYMDFFIAIRSLAYKEGYTTVLLSTQESDDSFSALYEQITNGNFAGVILTYLDGDNFDTFNFLECITESGINTQFAIITTDSIPNYNCVIVDAYSAEYQATKYFIDKGFTKIAFINGTLQRKTAVDKLAGYKKALIDNSIEINEDYISAGNYDNMTGYTKTRDLMLSSNPPEAIVCANDTLAMGSLKYLITNGYAVPNEVAVIGMDGTRRATEYNPSITTMRVPAKEIGEEATRMLLHKISHPRSSVQHKLFPITLMENSSTSLTAPIIIYEHI